MYPDRRLLVHIVAPLALSANIEQLVHSEKDDEQQAHSEAKEAEVLSLSNDRGLLEIRSLNVIPALLLFPF